jgi:hypothetical protein
VHPWFFLCIYGFWVFSFMCVIACSLFPLLLVLKCIVCIVLNAYIFLVLSFIIHVCYNYIHSHESSIAVTLSLVYHHECIIKCLFFFIILNIECIVLILNSWMYCSSSLSLLFMFIIYKPCQLPLSLSKDFRHNFCLGLNHYCSYT